MTATATHVIIKGMIFDSVKNLAGEIVFFIFAMFYSI